MFDSQIKETIPIQAYSLRLDIVLSTIRQLITHSRTSYGCDFGFSVRPMPGRTSDGLAVCFILRCL